MNSPSNSDCEGGLTKFPVFDEKRDMDNPKLKLGMIFKDVKVFRAALRENSIKEGYEFRFVKNDGNRVTVVCDDECPFRIHASKMQGSNKFQIKTMKKHIVHPRRYRMNAVTSTWAANKHMDRLIDDPKMKVKAIRRSVRREFGVFISNDQAYKTKWKALEQIEGNHQLHYKRIGNYCEILRANTDCRPVIGLDACHLKGPYGGQLMHVVSRDGNNQMYPIAMAIVEAECKDSWMWFLKLMTEVIERPEDMEWVFISDWQKIPPNTWARSYFSCMANCDMISNNISESFNQYIKESKDKPITTMMELIRRQLMKIYQEKKELLGTFTGGACPRIMKQIEEMKFHARNFEPTLAGEGIFEVMRGVRKTCNCRISNLYDSLVPKTIVEVLGYLFRATRTEQNVLQSVRPGHPVEATESLIVLHGQASEVA
ncbi:hypothetical protein ACH5RR_009025 [Cinchona calisaya]|uniref:Transposase MuDR plant domain-containing protein n=1 Tax=Cinchona calisaya TaxID=153742 RepID=A0ABD3AEY0_9GENT